MAQFDVHENRGRTRGQVPFLLNIQTRYLDDMPTRLVMPLRRVYPSSRIRPALLVSIEGTMLILEPEQVFPIAKRLLGDVLGSLAEDAQQIINAIDEVITTAYG